MQLTAPLNNASSPDLAWLEQRLIEINSEMASIQQADLVPQDRLLMASRLCREWMRLHGEILRLDRPRAPG